MTDKKQDQDKQDSNSQGQNKQSSFKMRGDKPKPTQVNKPLVWGVGVVVLLLITIIFVEALSPRQQEQQQSHIKHSSTSNTGSAKGGVNSLPSGYSNSQALKKYLPNQDQQLKQKLQQLQSSQSSLKNQLQQLKQQKSQPPQHHEQSQSPEQKQATMSGLFFPGGNPKKQKQNKKQSSSGSGQSQAQKSGGSKQPQSDYEKQNMQDEKIDFLKSSDQDTGDIYNTHGEVKPVSKYEVQAGSLIPATLMTAINTSLPGEAVAIVRRDIYDSVHGRYLLVPKGSKIIGQYQSKVSYGQSRVLIKFQRIIRPDGSSILLNNAPGADLFGQAGMQGSVDNHWGQVISAAVLSTTLSVGAGAVAQSTRGSGQEYPSSSENAINSAGGNISKVGQKITKRAINVQPTIKLPAGYEFNIIVNKDMILPPMGHGGRT